MEIARRQIEERARFMATLYELARGIEEAVVDTDQLATRFNLADSDLQDAVNSLLRNRLIGGFDSMQGVWLTHEGKRETEALLAGEKTQHFPDAVNIGAILNSQVQVGGPGNTQTVTADLDINVDGLLVWVHYLRETLPQLPLEESQRLELEADVGTIEQQAKSPRPKQTILRESAMSVRAILEGLAGSVAAQGLLHSLHVLGL